MCLREQTLGILVNPETTNISLNVHESYSPCLTSVSALKWPRFATLHQIVWQLLAAVHKRLDNASVLMFQPVWQPGTDGIYISWTKWGGFRAETLHADANWPCGIVPTAAVIAGFTSGATAAEGWSSDSGPQWGRSPLLSSNTFRTNPVSHRSNRQFSPVPVGIHGRGKVHHVSLGSIWMGALISSDVSICLMCPVGAVVPLWSNLILKKLAGRNTGVCSADTLRWSHTEQTKLRSPPETPGAGLPRHLSPPCLRAPPHTRTHARTCWYTVPV